MHNFVRCPWEPHTFAFRSIFFTPFILALVLALADLQLCPAHSLGHAHLWLTANPSVSVGFHVAFLVRSQSNPPCLSSFGLLAFSTIHTLPLSAPTPNGMLCDTKHLRFLTDSGQLTYYAMLEVPSEVPDEVVRSLHRAFPPGSCCALILSVSRMLPQTVMSPTPNVIGQHSCNLDRHLTVIWHFKNEITANGKKSMWTGTKIDKNFQGTASTGILSLVYKQ